MSPLAALFTFLLIFTYLDSSNAKITYDGYQLFNIPVTNETDLTYLLSLQSQRKSQIKARFFHTPMLNRVVDVLVAPDSVTHFKKELESKRIRYTISVDNFQKAIDAEQDGRKEGPSMTFKDSSTPTSLVTSKYLKNSEIDAYLAGLAKEYPNLVQLENIGTTYEGRALTVVKLSSKDGISAMKPAIWIDSGIHSREWIAPAVGLYLLNKLVTTSTRNATIRQYLDKANWYFLPVMNPDGYEYTHTQDRMWRKNRRRSATRCTAAYFDDSCCEGVDLNRNFAYNWGGPGASADPCDEIYRGPAAFSEPESKAVRDYILKHNDMKAFITMHSYSQMWFYPFGDKKRSYPADKDDLVSLATRATQALKSLYGTSFKVGTAADILYESSGGSDDWAKGVANIKYVFGVELRPSDDDSRYGFILPASFIIPSGEEMWAAVSVVADEVIKNFASSGGDSLPVGTAQSLFPSGAPVGTAQAPFPSGSPVQVPIPAAPRPICNNKSSSCWWFQSSGHCRYETIKQLCPLACQAC